MNHSHNTQDSIWTDEKHLSILPIDKNHYILKIINDQGNYYHDILAPVLNLKQSLVLWNSYYEAWLIEHENLKRVIQYSKYLCQGYERKNRQDNCKLTFSEFHPKQATVHWFSLVDKILIHPMSNFGFLDRNDHKRYCDVAENIVENDELIKDLHIDRQFLINKGIILRRGDLLKYTWIDDWDEFNQDVFIDDGKEFVPLLEGVMNVGMIPHSFTFPEFDISYWEGLLYSEIGLTGQSSPGFVSVAGESMSGKLKLDPTAPPLTLEQSLNPDYSEFYTEHVENVPYIAFEFIRNGQRRWIYILGETNLKNATKYLLKFDCWFRPWTRNAMIG